MHGTEIRESTGHFLAGGGEMGERMRQMDWTRTPLGPADEWPQSLKTAVRIMLTCRQPMFVWWGPELINLYNDAYKAIVGGKHPEVLGQPASVVWREIWDQVGPRAEHVLLRNEGTYDESLLLIMERNGYPEETYYTFSYSPIPADAGGTGGIICANTDDTARILGERQLALLRDLAAETANARNIADACRQSAAALKSDPWDIPFALIYMADEERKSVQLADFAGFGPEHDNPRPHCNLAEDCLWPISEVLETQQSRVVPNSGDVTLNFPSGAWDHAPQDVALVPIAPAGHTGRPGVLVVGLNPYRLFDDNYSGFLDLVAAQISAAVGNAQAYEEERKRAEALAELDRAKTTFFSNVSHEFRTPLTLMLGPVDDLLNDAETLPEPNREALEVVQRNGQRLLKLVNTLLDFSRVEAGRAQASFEPLDLPTYTAELASVFRSAVEKADLTLDIEAQPLSEPAYVDRDMWEKIVLNLISNAFKFTLEGGIKVSLRELDNRAVFTVQDTGTGIPEAEIPKLFNRFHRVEGARGRTHEGTGIGLALVQELARQHGGSVSVESVVDQGSTFTVSIPLGCTHLPEEHVAASGGRSISRANVYVNEALRWLPEQNGETQVLSPQAEGRVQAGRAHVVLADDNADMRAYVQRLLSQEYQVTAVADGEAALAAIRDQRPDLVLSDVMMPRLDGFGLLQTLRADPGTASIPIILLSARAGEEARVEGLEAGADDYLIKPFSARELLARVSGALAMARVRQEASRREQALQEEMFRVLESIQEGFIALDSEFKYLYVNDKAEKLIQKPRAELLGSSHWDVFPRAIGTPIETNFRKAMEQRVPVRFEHFYEPMQRWFENRVSPTDTGGIAIYFQDITEQRQTEVEKERFGHLIQTSSDFIGISDLDGNCLFVNDAGLRLVGIDSREQALKTNVSDCFFPEDRDFITDEFLPHVLRAGQAEVEIRFRHFKTGAPIWMAYNVVALHDESGDLEAFATVSRDITERLRAEKDRSLLAAIVQSSADAIISLDLNGKIVSWNRGAEQLYGYAADEVFGQSPALIIPPDRLQEERDFLSHIVLGEPIEPFETVRLTKSGGKVDVSLTISPVMDSNGRIVGASKIARNISDLKRTQEMLREADRRKDEFLATLAHELRNPLAPIRNGLKIMKLAEDDPATVEHARTMMERQLGQMVRLIDDLLDLSRITRGKVELRLEDLDVATAIQNALETSRPLIEQAGHQLVVELPSNPIIVRGDLTRLAQVFSNLLNNAAKYTDRGGEIRIRAGVEQGQAVVVVKDNGIGIPQEMLPRIFEMFTQVDQSLEKSHGGLGIGLNIVQHLVNIHGGTITAQSTGSGQGSEFTVRLPLEQPFEPETQPTVNDSATPKNTNKRRILVADDNDDIAQSLALLLQIKGNEVRVASDGEEAVAMAAEFQPEVILLDIGMPRLNGYEACRLIRQQTWSQNVRIFALTGWGQEEDKKRTEEAGFDHHLVKPVEPDDLFKLLP